MNDLFLNLKKTMRKILFFTIFTLVSTAGYSQRMWGKKLFIGMRSELIGSYYNSSDALKMTLKADTTFTFKADNGDLNYRVVGYEKHRLRRMTWFTLTDLKSPDDVAVLQMFKKKGGTFFVVFLDNRYGGFDNSYLHKL